MITISPFKALMPPPDKVGLVAAVPYDVVTREEAAEKAAGNPLSFLRASRSEIELPAEVDPYSEEVYEKARENFQRLRSQAPLTVDENESLYIYSLSLNDHRQTGIVAAASVDDYDSNAIKKHELTRKAKEDDRTRHTLALRAHTGPVFLTYRPVPAADEIVRAAMQTDPLHRISADDGVLHEIWRVPEEKGNILVTLFRDVPALYIADGHHRGKSASRARASCRDQNPGHTGNEAYNRFLSVIFPADQLNILAYNRAVRDSNGLSSEGFLEKVKAAFQVETTETTMPTLKGEVTMYLCGQWYRVTFPVNYSSTSPVDGLDVSILQNQLLDPILGIDDPRTNNRIEFIGGIHGPEKLQSLVDEGLAAVSFGMHPVTVDELMAISDADMIMPPKSTWFEPKLRDGILSHCF